MSQVSRITALLQERLLSYDPRLDVSPGSAVYNAVIAPVASALNPDPVDTDSLEFLKTRLKQEYPSLSVQDSDAVVSFLIKPLSLISESLKAELASVKLGQSTSNAESLTREQAVDHAANWFVRERTGSIAQTVVRIAFSAAQNVRIDATTQFTTDAGLIFYPLRAQVVRLETLLVQREGTNYYVDVPVIASSAGAEYNVAAGSIRRSNSFANAVSIRNLYAASGGVSGETPSELLSRVEQSLTERSLTSRRGIVARLFDQFGAQIRNLEVVGAGDPEMKRDIITGGGEGAVVATGICLIVGNYCLMISMFEDRGLDGARRVQAGNEIELNFWPFLYNLPQEEVNQKFKVESVLLDTREAMTTIPSIVLMTLDRSPSVPPPSSATVPGSYPGVFAVVRGEPVLEISDIPGGIGNPNTPRGTIEIAGDQIHVFGHNDIYVRPSADLELTNPFTIDGMEALVEGDDLCVTFLNEAPDGLNTKTFFVRRTKRVRVTKVGPPLQRGDLLYAGITLCGMILDFGSPDILYIAEQAGAEIFGQTINTGASYSTMSGSIITILEGNNTSLGSTELTELKGYEGLTLQILQGPNAGTYRLWDRLGDTIGLLSPLSRLEANLKFRIYREISNDVVDPKKVLHPFQGEQAIGLRTTIGSSTVRSEVDLRSLGVVAGDVLEIRSGSNVGLFEIQGFDSTLGGYGPILNRTLGATDSQVAYRVYRDLGGIQPPFVRFTPGGVKLLDAASVDTGSVVPYALPVGARTLNGFNGAQVVEEGRAGFVLPDPGISWTPTSDVTAAASTFPDKIACFSSGCSEPCPGYIAVISMTDQGDVYLDSGLPAQAQQFFTDLKNWILSSITTLGLGADFELFVQSFTPFQLGSPPGGATLVWQEEVCLPEELFDGQANIFVALPNIDWQSAFDNADSFQEVLSAYVNGLLPDSFTEGARPRVLDATAGDSLTIPDGPNRGSYIIDSVHRLRIPVLGSIVSGQVDSSRLYQVGLVVIRDSFPSPPAAGLSDFFAAGIPTLTVPAPPAFQVSVFDNTGTPISPWQTVNQTLTFLFQWANALGFNAPDTWDLDGGETLRQIWGSFTLPYTYGRTTKRDTLRLWFQEPTSVEVYAPSPRREYYPMVGLQGAVPKLETGTLSFPATALNAAAFTFWIRDDYGNLNKYDITLGASNWASQSLLMNEFVSKLQLAGAPISCGGGTAPNSLSFDLDYLSFTHKMHRFFSPVDTYLEISSDDVAALTALNLAAYSAGWQGQGSFASKAVYTARKPTRFVGVSAAQSVEFTPASNVEIRLWPAVFGELSSDDMPRDILISTEFQSIQQISVTQNPTNSTWKRTPTSGLDSIRVHEQRFLLELSTPQGTNLYLRDRSVGVSTVAGSTVVTLPLGIDPLYNFSSPSSGSDEDIVEVGDLVFIEEGESAGGYRITAKTPTTLTLDRPTLASTAQVLASGTGATIDLLMVNGNKKVIIPTVQPTLFPLVGRYVTIWGSNYPQIDGTYKIDAESVSGALTTLTLDMSGTFPVTDVNLQWAIINPPEITVLPSSAINGRTQLVGVAPIRIYKGTPKERELGFVAPLLDTSTNALFYVVTDSPFRTGTKEPYEIFRRDWLGISSTEMKSQERINGLYYFDVPVTSLGHSADHNVGLGFRLDAKFGTYSSDGYWFKVRDPNLTYSAREQTDLVFSPYFLPVGQEAVQGNKVSLLGKTVNVSFTYAPLVDQIQTLVTSDTDRNLCSDTLVRHFLPSYIYLDAVYTGRAAAADIAFGMTSIINGLEPTAPLVLSELENVFAVNQVTNYVHPITLISLSHDWDRRIVESRSVDRLDDANLAFNGTNRTTFYIPGPDRSSTQRQKDIPDGERIYLYQGVGTSSR